MFYDPNRRHTPENEFLQSQLGGDGDGARGRGVNFRTNVVNWIPISPFLVVGRKRVELWRRMTRTSHKAKVARVCFLSLDGWIPRTFCWKWNRLTSHSVRICFQMLEWLWKLVWFSVLLCNLRIWIFELWMLSKVDVKKCISASPFERDLFLEYNVLKTISLFKEDNSHTQCSTWIMNQLLDTDVIIPSPILLLQCSSRCF